MNNRKGCVIGTALYNEKYGKDKSSKENKTAKEKPNSPKKNY
jgi:hypothetical protein